MKVPLCALLLALVAVGEVVDVLMPIAIELEFKHAVRKPSYEENAAVQQCIGDVIEVCLETDIDMRTGDKRERERM